MGINIRQGKEADSEKLLRKVQNHIKNAELYLHLRWCSPFNDSEIA